MAVVFRNKLTGTIMRVADDRADEYRQLGYPEVVEKPSEKPAKRTGEYQKSERRTSSRRTSTRDDRERW